LLLGIGMPGSLELALICRRPVRGVEHNPIPRSGYATAYDNRKIVRWSTCEFVAGMRNLFISEGMAPPWEQSFSNMVGAQSKMGSKIGGAGSDRLEGPLPKYSQI
jgi:hypothetical protein